MPGDDQEPDTPWNRLVIATATVVTIVFATVMAEAQSPSPSSKTTELRAPSDFANIPDTAARSRALFNESAKVITHPRCMNCHPAGNTPLQGAEQRPHDPRVLRGPADHGIPGAAECSGCHTEKNYTLVEKAPDYQSIPG